MPDRWYKGWKIALKVCLVLAAVGVGIIWVIWGIRTSDDPAGGTVQAICLVLFALCFILTSVEWEGRNEDNYPWKK